MKLDQYQQMIQIQRLEQICMEDMYSRHQMREIIQKDVNNGLENRIERAVSDLVKYFEGTYYDSKNKRLDAYEKVCGLSMEELVEEICILVIPLEGARSIQTVVGQLAKILDYPDVLDGVKTAAEIIGVVAHSDIYDVILPRNSETGTMLIKSRYSLEVDTLVKLSKFKYLPPMITKPKTKLHNYSSSYLTKDCSVVLGSGNHHSQPLALEALNIASNVELSLDPWVLSQEETSSKPLDTPEKKKAFEVLVRSSREVYEELLQQGNRFYFDWNFDKRGRMYSSGYHVNIQSTQYKKALINLANPEVIRI